ncbi:MAG: histidine phosphatase family protein [Pyrinomonadaceae bacterium]|nr:histidine phosphatase family protein [Pyrinomonadaceae bacterium]
MNLTIYFLRHGQTPMSREDTFCGSGLDPELTQSGLEMARAFTAAYLSKPWSAIYSSPLQRTTATAQPLCDALAMEMQVRDDLKEIEYGGWEGHTKEAINRQYHDDYMNWLADPAWHPPTGGELAVIIARRGLRVVEEIRQRFTTGDVLVVSHKATIRIMLCSLLGIDVSRFRYRLSCPVGSVSVVEFTAQGPMLHTLADRSHLNESLKSLPGT